MEKARINDSAPQTSNPAAEQQPELAEGADPSSAAATGGPAALAGKRHL